MRYDPIQRATSAKIAEVIVPAMVHCLMEIEQEFPDAVCFVYSKPAKGDWRLFASYLDQITFEFTRETEKGDVFMEIKRHEQPTLSNKMLRPKNGEVYPQYTIAKTDPLWLCGFMAVPFESLKSYLESFSGFQTLTSVECQAAFKRILRPALQEMQTLFAKVDEREKAKLALEKTEAAALSGLTNYLDGWFPPKPPELEEVAAKTTAAAED